VERPYRVELLPSAHRELQGVPRDARLRVVNAIDDLATEPRPVGATLLSGAGPVRIWRLRVGQYRVLYQVEDDRLVVLVVRVADRREVYSKTAIKRLLGRLRRRE
jgi:mRNA interferase RelE/StbE